ncbi:hypothetical protein BJF78_19615 [Pseudonocardia sp. CNS-139]|nr:hypothetical protein BJF78_19615 [Pseudonocardia sp. CNS-139]
MSGTTTDTSTESTQAGGGGVLGAALRGGAWALVGTVVGRLANTAVLLVAAATLGSTDFGGVSIAISTVLVVASVSALGLPVAAQKLVAEAGDRDVARRERLIDVTAVLAVAVGVLVAVCFYAGSGLVASLALGDAGLALAVAAAAPLVLTTPFIEVLAGLLAARERFRSVGVLRAQHGIGAAVAVGIALAVAPGTFETLLALAAGEILTCCVGWWLLNRARDPRVRRVRLPRENVRTVARALLAVSLPAMLASVALQPAMWVGQLTLAHHPDGLAAVGLFAVALRWHAIALFVPATMGSVLLPMLGRLRATGRTDDARALFLRYGGLTLVFSTLACLVLVVGASLLMGLQGAEYLAGAGILTVLAVAVVPTALNNVLSQRAVAEGRLALWVVSDVALAVTLLVCALLLVPRMGGVGLAFSYLAAYVATCLVLLPIALGRRRAEPAP